MTPISNYIPLAQAAEANGYAGFTIPDSLIYPQGSDTEYSYTEDGGREFLENKPFIESFILATAIGVATKTLELTTNVVKLPVRPPLYSAKLASSIAALTGDRFNLGVGLSVWPEDYAAMGVPFAKRGKRFDECIAIVRGLCAGGYFEFHGEFYDLPSVKLNPVPGKPLPILIGGFSDAALKRAAHNDGFMYAGGNGGTDQLSAMIDKIDGYRAEAGTQNKPFRLFATAMGEIDVDAVKRHEDLGVTDMPIAFRNLYAVEEDRQPLADKMDDLKRFADDVIAKI
ncbi:alkanesulfonate monooxygenase SsuD/methylene tetrahydromethanopterin reductase-like flavin-dependent oxidoreductase (luciferase family) [Sphingobium vermicomposti]|uniref:Alkanesulfonate monooxygenase SsuD/methylene tetrahydromethanopterin reductase-like flavin-dependent oxidoreductase (Luciferase family) n=2 Tax=Sphingobium vermicomposti TaxID=529005 RepID=A0A846M0J5_9SPHN|nr:alkanesulfonate monooxygenase SsuD/methylene tetrahydromethanopterin reductase-like flavin-dependent oxidoreductase (luciferase family) [Sphingobium vermicomposti]